MIAQREVETARRCVAAFEAFSFHLAAFAAVPLLPAVLNVASGDPR